MSLPLCLKCLFHGRISHHLTIICWRHSHSASLWSTRNLGPVRKMSTALLLRSHMTCGDRWSWRGSCWFLFFPLHSLNSEGTSQFLVDESGWHTPETGAFQYFTAQSFIVLCNQRGLPFSFPAPLDQESSVIVLKKLSHIPTPFGYGVGGPFVTAL